MVQELMDFGFTTENALERMRNGSRRRQLSLDRGADAISRQQETWKTVVSWQNISGMNPGPASVVSKGPKRIAHRRIHDQDGSRSGGFRRCGTMPGLKPPVPFMSVIPAETPVPGTIVRLYSAVLLHHRRHPGNIGFSYGLFLLSVDLDELPDPRPPTAPAEPEPPKSLRVEDRDHLNSQPRGAMTRNPRSGPGCPAKASRRIPMSASVDHPAPGGGLRVQSGRLLLCDPGGGGPGLCRGGSGETPSAS